MDVTALDSFVGRAWLTVAVLVAVADVATLWFTRPRRIRPGPQQPAKLGAERPAIIHLLANRWRLGPEALTATVLDLIGRGLLAVDHVGNQPVGLRPARPVRPDDSLVSFERLLVDDVEALAAADGPDAVPLAGTARLRSRAWERRFDAAVRQEARRRRLSQPRLPAAVLLWLALVPALAALVVPVVRPVVELVQVPWGSAGPVDDGVLTPAVAAVALVQLLLVASLWRRRLEWDTREGRVVAARWAARRRQLAAEGTVAGPGRDLSSLSSGRLAEALALDLVDAGPEVGLPPAPSAPTSPSADGMRSASAPASGVVSGQRAWSGYSGRWRRVDISYRGLVPLGSAPFGQLTIEGQVLVSGPVRGQGLDRLVVDPGYGHRLLCLHVPPPSRWRPQPVLPGVGVVARVGASKFCAVRWVEVLSPRSEPLRPAWGPPPESASVPAVAAPSGMGVPRPSAGTASSPWGPSPVPAAGAVPAAGEGSGPWWPPAPPPDLGYPAPPLWADRAVAAVARWLRFPSS